MPGPARAGLFVYAKEPQRVAAFYEALAGMERRSETAERIVLESPDIQLLIHAIPEQVARGIDITQPPQRREAAAYKFFFTVASIAAARTTARESGGEVFEETWPGPGFVACNAMDPEGNVFQLREASA